MLFSQTDLLLAVITFFAAIVSGLAGFAFALMAAGAYFHFLPKVEAAALVIALSLVGQIVAQLRLRQKINWPRLWPFVIGGAFGLPVGLAALQVMPGDAFRLALGVFLLGYSSIGFWLGQPKPVAWGGRYADAGVGFVSGVLGGIAGLSGALITIWTGWRGWHMVEQRAVYLPFIVFNQAVGLLLILPFVEIEPFLRQFLIGAPLVVVGAWIGVNLFRGTSAAQFRLIVLALLAFSGLGLIIRQIMA